ncbi:MAG: tetratricopeptide repeat protein [Acidobacteria bacterium]|nr:tetratricopeptide repeat protein [Acidobacteriota bacterium]
MATSRDKVLRTAEKLVQKGKIEQAIREYEKLLKSNPNDANTINRVGDLYGRIGRIDDAIELYEKIADYFTQDGFTAKAIAILKKINRLAPQRVDIFERLAELYLKQNLVVEAKNQYDMLARWFEKEGDIENAIRIRKKLLELEPGNYPVRLHLADALMKVGKHEEAMNEYTVLGKLLLDKGKLDEAERLYNHILDLKPAEGAFLEPVVDALIGAGRHAEARKLLGRGIELLPRDMILNKLSARILLASGESKKARVRAENALSAHPDDVDLQVLAGRAAAATGDEARARELLLPVIDQSLKRGAFQEAQRLVDAVLELRPDDVEMLKRAGQVADLSGDRARSLEVKRKLAAGYRQAGLGKKALRLFNEISRLDPQDQQARKAIAELSGGAASSGESAARPAEEASPRVSDGGIMAETGEPGLGETGWAEAGASDTRSGLAVPPAAPAAEAAPVGFDPAERLAEANVFAKYGLEDKAIRHLEDILDFFPAMHAAREKLVSLYLDQDKPDEAKRMAGPLLEYYQEAGDTAKYEALVRSLGSVPELSPVSRVQPADQELELGIDEGDEVLFIDFDEEPAAEQPLQAIEPPVGGAASGQTAEKEAVSFAEELADVPVQEEDAGPGAGAEGPGEEALSLSEPPAPKPFSGVPQQSDILAELDELEHSLLADHRPVRTSATPEELSLEPLESLLGEVSPATRMHGEAASAEAQTEASPSNLELDVPEEVPEELGVEELVDVSGAVDGPPIVVLQQIDFFIEQGLYEDALRILSGLEMDFPDDPDVAKRRLTLKERGIIVEESVPAEAEDTAELFAEEDGYVDLAQELEAELAEEEALVEAATGEGQDEALLDEVFKEFRKGVAEQLSEEDSDTHFNLGIAYKEMGLFPEAIGEFEIASKDPKFYLECCSMIAVCYVEQGLFDQAVSWYRRALDIEDLPKAAQLALMYDLATVLESAGDDIQAIDLYSQVAEMDPEYRDISSRLQDLQKQRNVN